MEMMDVRGNNAKKRYIRYIDTLRIYQTRPKIHEKKQIFTFINTSYSRLKVKVTQETHTNRWRVGLVTGVLAQNLSEVRKDVQNIIV